MLMPSLVVMALIVSFLSLCLLPRASRAAAPKPDKRSVVPPGRYPAKEIAGDRHPADGRERHVRGHQPLAGRRQLPQKTEPHTGRLLRVVFEAVVPLGVVERDREYGVAAEHQPVAAGRQAYDTVPGGVAAGESDHHARRDLVLFLERPQLALVLVQELLGRPASHV